MDSNVETFIVAQMQAAALILDDIEDRSLVRRGKACWYRRRKDVGLMAINDGLMLEHSVYYLIEKYFKKKECYPTLTY